MCGLFPAVTGSVHLCYLLLVSGYLHWWICAQLCPEIWAYIWDVLSSSSLPIFSSCRDLLSIMCQNDMTYIVVGCGSPSLYLITKMPLWLYPRDCYSWWWWYILLMCHWPPQAIDFSGRSLAQPLLPYPTLAIDHTKPRMSLQDPPSMTPPERQHLADIFTHRRNILTLQPNPIPEKCRIYKMAQKDEVSLITWTFSGS